MNTLTVALMLDLAFVWVGSVLLETTNSILIVLSVQKLPKILRKKCVASIVEFA